jgi:NAD(P)-dependent dehydrogenase (short-subunit alcohol dehydrogenase family)
MINDETIDEDTGFLMPSAKNFDVLNLFSLKNTTTIITGSAHGIGRVAAIACGKAGGKIAITDKDFKSAKILEKELIDAGIEAKAWELNITNEENIITLNLTSAFICCRTAANYMLKNKKGSIINISSIMGVTGGGPAPNSPYHASKGGLVNLTRSLANEWGSRGIRVNSIGPTYTKTRLVKQLNADKEKLNHIIERTPLKRLAEVSEMAGGILYLASDASSIVTGHTLMLDGGWSAI